MSIDKKSLDQVLVSIVDDVNEAINNIEVEEFHNNVDDIQGEVEDTISNVDEIIEELEFQRERITDMRDFLTSISKEIDSKIEKLRDVKDSLEYCSSNLQDASAYAYDAWAKDIDNLWVEGINCDKGEETENENVDESLDEVDEDEK